MKFFLVKSNNHYLPADEEDHKKSSKIGSGEIIEVTCTNQRNIKFHRKYWSLINTTLHNLPETAEKELMSKHQFRITSKEDLHFYVKIKNGYVEKRFIGKDGNIGWVPTSISFSSMDEDKFNEFYDKAVRTCAELLGLEDSELTKHILEEFG